MFIRTFVKLDNKLYKKIQWPNPSLPDTINLVILGNPLKQNSYHLIVADLSSGECVWRELKRVVGANPKQPKIQSSLPKYVRHCNRELDTTMNNNWDSPTYPCSSNYLFSGGTEWLNLLKNLVSSKKKRLFNLEKYEKETSRLVEELSQIHYDLTRTRRISTLKDEITIGRRRDPKKYENNLQNMTQNYVMGLLDMSKESVKGEGIVLNRKIEPLDHSLSAKYLNLWNVVLNNDLTKLNSIKTTSN